MDGDGLITLAAFVLASAAAALPGILLRPGAWYRELVKPPWRPPNWLFGPVWAVLYIMIAVAGWLVWQAGPWAQTGPALALFALQLVLNALWSMVFFGLHRPGWAAAEMSLLWLSIMVTIVLFHAIDATAAWLLVPYAAWVSFALALNVKVWQLNRPPARSSSPAP